MTRNSDPPSAGETPAAPPDPCEQEEELVPPTEDEINALEKAVWDSGTDRVLVWYRDRRDQAIRRMREADRSSKLDRQRAIRAEADLTAARAEIAALRHEIAEAREACPSGRMQDYFDAPLLTLVNKEVSRGFNRDAELDKTRAEIASQWRPNAEAVGRAYREMLHTLIDAGVPILIPSDSLPPHWQVAVDVRKVIHAQRAEIARLTEDVRIRDLATPLEEELYARIDETLKYLAQEQGFTLASIARLLADCQRRMAADWLEIGAMRRTALAASPPHPETEGP